MSPLFTWPVSQDFRVKSFTRYTTMARWTSVLQLVKGCLLTFFGFCGLTVLAILRSVEYEGIHQRNNEEFYAKTSANVFTQLRAFPRGGDEISLKPQWDLLPMRVENDSAPFLIEDTAKYVVTNFSFSPGIGNIMFQYAALFGIAKRHGATLIIPEGILLRRAFQLSATAVSLPVLQDMFDLWTPKVVYTDCCRYYNESETLTMNKTVFMGYFQSFKYFSPTFAKELKSEFQFLPYVKQKAQKHLDEALGPIKDHKKRVLIGMHIRRGMDIEWNMRNIEHGHVVATKRYLLRAMDYFRKKFKDPIFVVCSDNLFWCKKHLVGNDVVFVKTSARETDLCVLSLCSHTIMSQGTFSWWAAYLTGGEAVYFKNWPRRGSKMDLMTVKEDYFMPHWVGLD